MKKVYKFLIVATLAMGMCFTNLGGVSALTQEEFEANATLMDYSSYTYANDQLMQYFGKTVADYTTDTELLSALQLADVLYYEGFDTVAEADSTLMQFFGKSVADYATGAEVLNALKLAENIDYQGFTTLAEAQAVFVAHGNTTLTDATNYEEFAINCLRFTLYDAVVTDFTSWDLGFDEAEIKALADDVVSRVLPATVLTYDDAIANFIVFGDNYSTLMDEADAINPPSLLSTDADYEAAAKVTNLRFNAYGFTGKYYINGVEITLYDLYKAADDNSTLAKFDLCILSGDTVLASSEGTVYEVAKLLGVTSSNPITKPEPIVEPAPVAAPTPTVAAPATTPTVTTTTTTSTTKMNTPNTGDNSNIAMFSTVALGALACLIVLRKKVNA